MAIKTIQELRRSAQNNTFLNSGTKQYETVRNFQFKLRDLKEKLVNGPEEKELARQVGKISGNLMTLQLHDSPMASEESVKSAIGGITIDLPFFLTTQGKSSSQTGYEQLVAAGEKYGIFQKQELDDAINAVSRGMDLDLKLGEAEKKQQAPEAPAEDGLDNLNINALENENGQEEIGGVEEQAEKEAPAAGEDFRYVAKPSDVVQGFVDDPDARAALGDLVRLDTEKNGSLKPLQQAAKGLWTKCFDIYSADGDAPAKLQKEAESAAGILQNELNELKESNPDLYNECCGSFEEAWKEMDLTNDLKELNRTKHETTRLGPKVKGKDPNEKILNDIFERNADEKTVEYKVPAKKNPNKKSYQRYYQLHSGNNIQNVSDAKLPEYAAKALAGLYYQNQEKNRVVRGFDLDLPRKFAKNSMKSMDYKAAIAATKPEDLRKALADGNIVKLSNLVAGNPDERYHLSENARKQLEALGTNMKTEKRSKEWAALKTALTDPDMKNSSGVFQAVENYLKGKKSVRHSQQGRDSVDLALNALAIVAGNGDDVAKQRAKFLVDRINTVRNVPEDHPDHVTLENYAPAEAGQAAVKIERPGIQNTL